ncbi:MAG: hypothetical protein ABII12_13365 [Planctomycetota bacterium]
MESEFFNNLLKEARTQMDAKVQTIEKDLQRLASITSSSMVKRSEGQHNAKEVAASCIEVMREVQSYRSWGRDRQAKAATPEAEWWVNVYPEKYHVTTRVGNDWDEWITIRSEHYRSFDWRHTKGTGRVVLWSPVDPQADNAYRKNEYLSVRPYLKLLDAADPMVCSMWASADEEDYFLLEFSAKEFPVGDTLFALSPARLWVHAKTRFVAKAEIELTEKENRESGEVLHDQMFTTYNDRVAIWAPHLNMNALRGDQDPEAGSLGTATIISDMVESVPRWGIQTGGTNTRDILESINTWANAKSA